MLTLVVAGQLIDGVSSDTIPTGVMLASRKAKWLTPERDRKAGIKFCASIDVGFMIPDGAMDWRCSYRVACRKWRH